MAVVGLPRPPDRSPDDRNRQKENGPAEFPPPAAFTSVSVPYGQVHAKAAVAAFFGAVAPTAETVKSDMLEPVSVQPLPMRYAALVAESTPMEVVSRQLALP